MWTHLIIITIQNHQVQVQHLWTIMVELIWLQHTNKFEEELKALPILTADSNDLKTCVRKILKST